MIKTKLAGHQPLQEAISRAIEEARMKSKLAEGKDCDEKDEKKVKKLVAYEKKEHGHVPSEKEEEAEKKSSVIDFSDPEEVEKLAAALDEAADILTKEADSIENGKESKQGGEQLATSTPVGGTQPYKKDASKSHNVPMKTPEKSTKDNPGPANAVETDEKRQVGPDKKQPDKILKNASVQEPDELDQAYAEMGLDAKTAGVRKEMGKVLGQLRSGAQKSGKRFGELVRGGKKQGIFGRKGRAGNSLRAAKANPAEAAKSTAARAAIGAKAVATGVGAHAIAKKFKKEKKSGAVGKHLENVGKGAFGKVMRTGGAEKAMNPATAQRIGAGVYGAGALAAGAAAKGIHSATKKKESAVDAILAKISGVENGGESKQGGEQLSNTAPVPSNPGRQLISSNSAPKAATKREAKAPRKAEMAQVVTEPMNSKAHDSKVHENLRNAAKGGVKIAAARDLLAKIAEEGCTCSGDGSCRHCVMKTAKAEILAKRAETVAAEAQA